MVKMIGKLSLCPTWRSRLITDISPEFFIENGINIVFLDLDNTLVTVKSKQLTCEASDWIISLVNNNIRVRIVSNNLNSRVSRLVRTIEGVGFNGLSMKPMPRQIVKYLDKFEPIHDYAIMIGDGISTDILAANLSGVRSILIDPIEDKNIIGVYNKLRRSFINVIFRSIKII